MIAPGEQATLIDFLQTGKGLYIEGPDFSAENQFGPLHPMFGCAFVEHGYPSATGNVITLEGQDGTFAAGLEYGYLYQEGPDNSVDVIEENGGTLLFKSQEDNGRVVYYSGPSSNYRAVHSTVIFGALKNDVNTKDELMNSYMDYLTELTGIEDHTAEQSNLSFSIFPNPVISSANVNFNLIHPGRVAIRLYNTAGQLVRELADGEYGAGAHELVWCIDDDQGRELPNGTYIISVEIDSKATRRTVVLVR